MSPKIAEALEKLRKAGERLRESATALEKSAAVLLEAKNLLDKASNRLGQAAEKLQVASRRVQDRTLTISNWRVFYSGKSNLITLQNTETTQVYMNLRFNVGQAAFEDERAPQVSWTDRQIIAQALGDLQSSGSKELAN